MHHTHSIVTLIITRSQHRLWSEGQDFASIYNMYMYNEETQNRDAVWDFFTSTDVLTVRRVTVSRSTEFQKDSKDSHHLKKLPLVLVPLQKWPITLERRSCPWCPYESFPIT